jgi:hypothetical protein
MVCHLSLGTLRTDLNWNAGSLWVRTIHVVLVAFCRRVSEPSPWQGRQHLVAGILPVLAAVEFGLERPAWCVLLVVPYALFEAFDTLALHRLLLVAMEPRTSLFAVHPPLPVRKLRLRRRCPESE